MPDQYDAIGALYERVKSLPVGLVEQATLLAALPDLAGRSVLDVGTGTGFYPRTFKRLGAGRVVGVDGPISDGVSAAAQAVLATS